MIRLGSVAPSYSTKKLINLDSAMQIVSLFSKLCIVYDVWSDYANFTYTRAVSQPYVVGVT